MQAKGVEFELVRSQFQARSSIFACNKYAVISAQKLELGKDDCGNMKGTWVNDLPEVPMGDEKADTQSFLNTKVFIMAWDTLMNSGEFWDMDFAVKADPDCVFFPSRLRSHVAPQLNANAYFLNCLYDSKPKIFGALEVFSTVALKNYQAHIVTCKEMDWSEWGEDLYMQVCMKVLGAIAAEDYDLVGDDRCKGAPCSDVSKVAYHPYKDLATFWTCHNTSAQAAKKQGMPQLAI